MWRFKENVERGDDSDDDYDDVCVAAAGFTFLTSYISEDKTRPLWARPELSKRKIQYMVVNCCWIGGMMVLN
jgi:hypothetical protein